MSTTAVAVETPVEVPKPPRKEVQIIQVLAEKVTGHVKWYSTIKRYGFISRNDDGGDLFVHRSVISAYTNPFPSLLNGEEVEFTVVETNQGIEASCVTGPGGQPVKGVRLYNRRYRTNSEPSRVKNASTAENAEGDNAQPCLSNGRYRPRRRRGGGGGVGKSAKAQSGQNESYDDGTTTQQKSNDQSYKEGNISATPGVFPRQWRRPYGNIRHRSAPTRNFSTVNVGDGRFTSGEITGSQDSRYYQRGFRRPFRRPMGNFRYSNGYYIGRVNFSQSRFQPAYDSQNSQGGSYRGRGRGYNSRRPRRRFNNTDHVSSNGIRSVNGVTEQEKTNDTTSVHDIQKEVEADLSVNNLNNVDNVLPDTTESNE